MFRETLHLHGVSPAPEQGQEAVQASNKISGLALSPPTRWRGSQRCAETVEAFQQCSVACTAETTWTQRHFELAGELLFGACKGGPCLQGSTACRAGYITWWEAGTGSRVQLALGFSAGSVVHGKSLWFLLWEALF